MEKLISLAVERNIRSAINANIVPSDINTLVDARKDFERLCSLAYSIANQRN